MRLLNVSYRNKISIPVHDFKTKQKKSLGKQGFVTVKIANT